MQITPKDESELSSGFEPLPTGVYPFTVLESAVQISKSAKNAGREMVKLKISVHGDGRDKHVYDYFADWFSEWKLKHFCDTTGLVESYAAGSIHPEDDNYQGRGGYVKLGIEVNKDTGEEHNIVVDYIVKEEKPVAKPTAKPTRPRAEADTSGGDDVPF